MNMNSLQPIETHAPCGAHILPRAQVVKPINLSIFLRWRRESVWRACVLERCCGRRAGWPEWGQGGAGAGFQHQG